jgi:hypothetical protein
MVLDYETQALPAPVPSVHNKILSEFHNQVPGDLPGAYVRVSFLIPICGWLHSK